MIFFSADRAEVETVAQKLLEEGIECRVRVIEVPSPSDAEVWICNDQDFYRATLFCVGLSIGFAKRAKEKQLAA